jgi:hypothetical protein
LPIANVLTVSPESAKKKAADEAKQLLVKKQKELVEKTAAGVQLPESPRQKLNGTDYNLQCPDSPCVHS